MRILKKFEAFLNEKVIMPNDFSEMMDRIRDICAFRPLSVERMNAITNPYGVLFVTYDQFYNKLPVELKHTAPPRGTPLFGFIDEDNAINIVASIPVIGIRELPFINHMIQHESVHVGQWNRRAGKVKWTLPDPKDRKSYFSNKDEIMAFSQSIVEMLLNNQRLRSLDQIESELEKNRLWTSIIELVDEKTKNRYLKYIYEYAKNYLNPEDETR